MASLQTFSRQAPADLGIQWVVLPGVQDLGDTQVLMTKRMDDVIAGRALEAIMWGQVRPIRTIGLAAASAMRAEAAGRSAGRQAPALIEAVPFETRELARPGTTGYQGPGQIGVYVILNLRKRKMTPRALIEVIEGAVIDTAAEFDVKAERRDDHPGVWVGSRQLTGIVLSVRNGVSGQGFTLNVDTDLEEARHVNPCSIGDCQYTSLAEERRALGLARRALRLDRVAATLRSHLQTRLGPIVSS